MLQLEHSTAYLRDNFVPLRDSNISIASSAVLYGLTIYSVFPVCWNPKKHQLYIFRLKDHYQRLVNSAKIMDFGDFLESWDYPRFEAAMLELLAQNNLKEDSLVRVAVFVDELAAGTRIHGLKNSVSAYVYPAGQLLNPAGAHVCVSSWTRTADNAIPSRAKLNGSYINASLLKNEALLNGYDEAISLDQAGHVAEGSVANIFMVRDGVLITPDAATDVLEGITRDSLMVLAAELNIKVVQRSIDRSELYIADEIFFCGSSARVTPVLSIDKRPIGDGQAGLVTQQLQKLYGQIQHGEVTDTHDWLFAVQ